MFAGEGLGPVMWMTVARTLRRRREPRQRRFGNKTGSTMSATLTLTHKAIGAEVRRGPYDVVVDGERIGLVEMNDTIEIPVEPGRHTRRSEMAERRAVLNPRRRPGRDRRLPMHRKEVLADLCGVLHRSQPGTETCSRFSRRRRRGAHRARRHRRPARLEWACRLMPCMKGWGASLRSSRTAS